MFDKAADIGPYRGLKAAAVLRFQVADKKIKCRKIKFNGAIAATAAVQPIQVAFNMRISKQVAADHPFDGFGNIQAATGHWLGIAYILGLGCLVS
jgi:hypothetical protein